MTVDFMEGSMPKLNLYATFVGQIKHFLKASNGRFFAIGASEPTANGDFFAIDMAIPSQKAGYYTITINSDDVDYAGMRLCAEVLYGADSKDINDALLDPDGYGLCDETVCSPNIGVVSVGDDDIDSSTAEKYALSTAKSAFEPYRTEYFVLMVNNKTKSDFFKNVRAFYISGEYGIICKDIDFNTIFPSPDTKGRVQKELKNIESMTYSYGGTSYGSSYVGSEDKKKKNTTGFSSYSGGYSSGYSYKTPVKGPYVDAQINIDNPKLEDLT